MPVLELLVRDAEQFKIGFLSQMAEMGLVPSDFEQAMQKQSIKVSWPTLAGLGGATSRVGLMALLGIPLVAGGLTGGIARSAMKSDDEDADEVKSRETAQNYRQLAREIRERTNRARQQ